MPVKCIVKLFLYVALSVNLYIICIWRFSLVIGIYIYMV